MKIVSLLPSATEIVHELGLGGSLAGVSYECDFPDGVQAKPVVVESALTKETPLSAREIDEAVRGHMEARQPIYVLHKELIQALEPDLILAQDLCRVCAVPSGQVEDALAEIGTDAEVISLDPHSIDEILDGILEVGRATGTEDRAREVVGGLRERIARLKETAAGLPAVRTLALEWFDPPYVGGHWVPEMVLTAGGEALLNAPMRRSTTATWREIADARPEVIVFMPCGYSLDEAVSEGTQIFAVPELAGIVAPDAGRVFAVDATAYFSRPGPRIVDGLEMLAWAIHPDAHPEPEAGRIAPLRPPR